MVFVAISGLSSGKGVEGKIFSTWRIFECAVLEIIHINLSHFIACEGTKIKAYFHCLMMSFLSLIFQLSSCL